MGLTETSKYIAYILRHCPQDAGVALDEHGWAEVDALIEGVGRKHPLDRQTLERIMAEDSKQRYSFSEDGTRIRANQGHSIHVDVELKESWYPYMYLYHGTGRKSVESILAEGLKPRGRLHVHLSESIETAKMVGSRHGDPVVFAVSAYEMQMYGYQFFVSENGVWLTEEVPPEFLTELDDNFLLPPKETYAAFAARFEEPLRRNGFMCKTSNELGLEDVIELGMEAVSSGHPLCGRPVYRVAKRGDDVIFCDGTAYYLVHLSYSSEFSPDFPSCRCFADGDALMAYLESK